MLFDKGLIRLCSVMGLLPDLLVEFVDFPMEGVSFAAGHFLVTLDCILTSFDALQIIVK